ncbi:hypothetical protein HT118_13980 [Escherichia coli]|nr:hypothetical protein [Escherichia coli]
MRIMRPVINTSLTGKWLPWLVEWKNATETQWLKDSPSQPLQQSLKDLERAYKNFFRKRAAFPRFKKRGQNDAFRYPQGVKLDQENSRIFFCRNWAGCVTAIAVRSRVL